MIEVVQVPTEDTLPTADDRLVKVTARSPARCTRELPLAGGMVVFHAERTARCELRKARDQGVTPQIVDRPGRPRLEELTVSKPCGERVGDPRRSVGYDGQRRQAASITQQRHGELGRSDWTRPVNAMEQCGRSAQPFPDFPRQVVSFVRDRQILRPAQKGLRELDRDESGRAGRIDDELRADGSLKLSSV